MSAGKNDRKARRQSKFFNRKCVMRPEEQDHHSTSSNKNAETCVSNTIAKSSPAPPCIQERPTEEASAVSIRPSS